MESSPSKKPAAKPSLFRLLALLKPKQGKYILGLVGRVAITTIERLVIAYIAKLSIDAIVSGDTILFRNTLINWVLFYLGYLIVAPFVLYLWHSAIYEGTAAIRETVFKHLNRLPIGYHELHHSGDALSILTNDVSAAEKAYQEDLLRLFEAAAQGITAAVYMLLLNWQLALLIIASGLMPLIINTLFAKPLRVIGDAVQANLGGLSERMTDLLAGYAVVRTFNLGDWILNRFEQANGQVLSSSLRRVRTESALAGTNEFGGLFGILPMVFGAYLVLNGQTTFGVLVGLIQLSNGINYFVYSLGGTISRIQAALAAADRVLNLLDEPLEPESYENKTVVSSTANAVDETTVIKFSDVDFAYNGGPNILNRLTFNVQPGQMVAFAGPSGGGKSTIFKLLLGCYPPRQGEIQVDQRALRATRLSDLRRLFAYVPQDAYLFAGTIYDNIRYGQPDATEDAITAAAKAAFAHDFISEFPASYQTVVGEHGARLSGGQRQRISIARALLKNAPILLLDEATSALDSESEQIVQQALEVLMRGRTTLVIAHRLSTILNADQIYVIADGSVAEAGKHAELLDRKGIYANLFELQYKLQNA
jgi:ATP-binding cassette, subfamily B, bacterial